MPCGRRGFGLAELLAIGQNLEPGDPSENEHTDRLTRCPSCGWEITGDFSWCPKCGKRLRPFRCEYCQSLVPVEFEECPHCGAQI